MSGLEWTGGPRLGIECPRSGSLKALEMGMLWKAPEAGMIIESPVVGLMLSDVELYCCLFMDCTDAIMLDFEETMLHILTQYNQHDISIASTE